MSAATKKEPRPSLAMTLQGLDLVLCEGTNHPRGARRIEREDGSLWFEGTAWEISRLFLSAPDMLDALRDADDDLGGAHHEACPWFTGNAAMGGDCNCGLKATHTKVKAALAKAEGRHQP